MTQRGLIDGLLVERTLWRRQELMDAGATRAGLRDAGERGQLVNVAHGVLASPDTAKHPLVDDAICCLVTGGVICGRSAAMRLSLSDDVPDLLEMIVSPARSRPPATLPLLLRRTQDPMAFTVGVEETLVGGVAVRMTGRARTVVDQYRFGVPEQHALQALHTYLGEGGSGNELIAIDTALGGHAWRIMQRDVAGFALAKDRSYGREPERQDEPPHGDGPWERGLRGHP